MLHKASQPEASKRQEALSEFLYDLQSPGAQFHRLRAPPLVERNPVRFWQAVSFVQLLCVLLLLGLRAYDH